MDTEPTTAPPPEGVAATDAITTADATGPITPAPPAAPSDTRADFVPWGPWATLGIAFAVLGAWLIAQVIGLVAAMAGVAAAGVPPASQPSAIGIPHAGFAVAVATLVGAPAGIGLTVLFARLRGRVGSYLGLVRPTLGQTVLWTLGLGLFMGAFDLLSRLVDRPPVPEFMVEVYRTALVLPLLWLAVVVAAPLFEETLFRGFLIPGLASARWLGAPGAALVSALLFAVLHVGQYDLFDLSFVVALGLFFAAARLATGSLVLAIWLHLINNLVSTIQIEWVLRGG